MIHCIGLYEGLKERLFTNLSKFFYQPIYKWFLLCVLLHVLFDSQEMDNVSVG